MSLSPSEKVPSQHIDGGLELRVLLVVLAGQTLGVVALGVQRGDFRLGHAEQEEVLGAHALTDLDVGAIEGADGQSAVEGELHVAGAGGFLAGLGDLLVEVGGRDEVHGQLDVVVPREVDVQLALDVRVVLMTRATLLISWMVCLAR